MQPPPSARVRTRGSGPAVLGPVRRAPLAVRLAILLATLTAVVFAAAFVAVSIGTRARARELLSRQLAAHQASLAALQRQTLQQELVASALIAEMPSLRAALAIYREESRGGRPRPDLVRTIRSALEPITPYVPQSLLVITDDEGRVLWAADRSGATLTTGTDLSAVPAVKDALDGVEPTLESSFAYLRIGDVLFNAGCVPIVQNGSLRGVLLLGDRLDSAAVSRLQGVLASDVVVRTATQVLATSLPTADGAALARHAGTVDIDGSTYVVSSVAVGRTADGAAVEMDLLRSLAATIGPLQGALNRGFLIYGLLAVGLATLAAIGVARSQLQSFRDFVGFMGSVAESRDYTRRFSDRDPTPEVETLTSAYEQLIASLSESHAQLVERGAELARANTVLLQEMEDRKKAETTLRERDEQLRQSQKLEAVGTLAGGVAHDFNNLLTVIHSYTELLMQNVDHGGTMHSDLDQIRQAAARAGRLTSQLLAFSRKQVMQPRVVDLSQIVSGIETMLRRLIGEHIHLESVVAERVSLVKADPGQIEQVIMNLAVNARDAMPKGGRLVLSTRNVVLHEASADHGETPAGKWVVLSVKDTGTGMDESVKRRVFEPFFTTKPVGQGTGLGLSMVYGIVKQSGGYIQIDSAPGAGSEFRIYLPVFAGSEEDLTSSGGIKLPLSGSETILLVEDEEMVRTLGERTLRGHGYTVLSAPHGAAALNLLERHQGSIELLLTDVVMPEMSGKDLADEVSRLYPTIRILFMSGYTEDTIATQGILEEGVSLLQKPFTPSGMARRVREVLDAPAD